MGNHYVPSTTLTALPVKAGCGHTTGWSREAFSLNQRLWLTSQACIQTKVEQYLANQIEAPAQAAIEKVRNLVPLEDSDRIALATYIVALWKRVPEGRRRASERMPEVAASVKADVLARIDELVEEDPSRSGLGDERRAQVESIIKLYEEDPPPDIWHKSLHTGVHPKVVQCPPWNGAISMLRTQSFWRQTIPFSSLPTKVLANQPQNCRCRSRAASLSGQIDARVQVCR